MTVPELHITIATTPTGGGLRLSHETRLVKAALLYADRVTLASFAATMLGTVAAARDATAAERRELVLSTLPAAGVDPQVMAVLEVLRRKRRKTRDELILLGRYEAQLSHAVEGFGRVFDEMLEKAEPQELEVAIAAGLVDLDPLGMDTGEFESDAIVQRMVDLMANIVAPSSTTYPMFDDSAAGLLRSMIKEGKVEGVDLGPATQVGIAGHFIQAVEAFPDAPMDVVLDARTKLRAPLVRFRAAVVGIAEQLEATPVDENFGRVANDLYREHVAPVVLELDEISRELRLREALRREVLSGTGVNEAAGAATAALGLGTSAVASLPELVQVLAAGGALLGGIKAAVDIGGAIYRRRLEALKQRNDSKFLFLFEVDRELRRRS